MYLYLFSFTLQAMIHIVLESSIILVLLSVFFTQKSPGVSGALVRLREIRQNDRKMKYVMLTASSCAHGRRVACLSKLSRKVIEDVSEFLPSISPYRTHPSPCFLDIRLVVNRYLYVRLARWY